MPVQDPAFGPPQDIALVLVGFAMAGVAAIADTYPKPVNQFARGDVAPVLDDISLVLALVVNHRLPVHLTPLTHAFDIPVLHASVGHIVFGVVVAVLKMAVVN